MSKHNFRMYENLALLSQVGIMMAVYIVGSVMLGNFIDEKLGTSPLFLIGLLLLGLAAAFYNVFKMLYKVGTNSKEQDKWKK